MELQMERSWAVLGATVFVGISVIACQKSAPLSPTVPTSNTVTPADGSTLKASAPTPVSPSNGVRLETFTTPTLTANGASPTNGGGGISYQYRFQLMSDTGAVLQDSGLQNSTNWTPTAALDFDKTYSWWVRAESSGAAGPWSSKASFISPNGGFIRGQNVFDPLTNGKTVATRVLGGHFVTGSNGGWESNAMSDGLDYDIPTCDSCKVEFDVTNFGNGEGVSAQVDVKWFSMGDASAWGGFTPFRDHPWKMHVEQRSDGDGSGMQLIWRNGAADADSGGDPDYGDHRGKFLDGGPAWGHSFDNTVWHFTISWTRTSYFITIGELGQPATRWFPGPGGDSGFFGGGHAYAPPNHRIELGCTPRNESMVGARYRNFKVTPQ
jgi:hypothetical protein